MANNITNEIANNIADILANNINNEISSNIPSILANKLTVLLTR